MFASLRSHCIDGSCILCLSRKRFVWVRRRFIFFSGYIVESRSTDNILVSSAWSTKILSRLAHCVHFSSIHRSVHALDVDYRARVADGWETIFMFVPVRRRLERFLLVEKEDRSCHTERCFDSLVLDWTEDSWRIVAKFWAVGAGRAETLLFADGVELFGGTSIVWVLVDLEAIGDANRHFILFQNLSFKSNLTHSIDTKSMRIKHKI